MVTDTEGAIKQLVDYYPYGSVHFEELGSNYDNDYLYTGKELDEELGLYYYGARYYHAVIGRFVSVDPLVLASGDKRAIERMTKRSSEEVSLDPQILNGYAYARNNPLKYIDPSGEFAYIETALDAMFFALSARDFYLNPSLTTGAWAFVDAAGLALPVPSAVGYIKNSTRVGKILTYFTTNVAARTGKSIYDISVTFLKNAFFKQELLQWSLGEAGDSLANLVGHFVLHAAEVGAKNLDEYYEFANKLVNSKVGGDILKKFDIKEEITYVYNKATNEFGITGTDQTIRTYFKPEKGIKYFEKQPGTLLEP